MKQILTSWVYDLGVNDRARGRVADDGRDVAPAGLLRIEHILGHEAQVMPLCAGNVREL